MTPEFVYNQTAGHIIYISQPNHSNYLVNIIWKLIPLIRYMCSVVCVLSKKDACQLFGFSAVVSDGTGPVPWVIQWATRGTGEV